jgi:preprotein translocase SecE subunit
MGRQARRQQARAERRARRQQRKGGAPPRGPGITPSAPAPAHPDEPSRGRGSLLRPRWATDIISELRKVTWPSRQETAHLTVVVVIVSAIFGAVLGGADVAFGWIVERTILR